MSIVELCRQQSARVDRLRELNKLITEYSVPPEFNDWAIHPVDVCGLRHERKELMKGIFK